MTSAAPTALRPRSDADVAERFARSAAATEGAWLRTEDFGPWLAERGRATFFQVDRIPLAELDGWSFDERTGNLAHRTGRFFSVEGLHIDIDGGAGRDWWQPIINQPEIGILGIVVKEFGGVLHFLMQAKMEPGNPGLLQLSPTVQATRSNYTRMHGGSAVRYLEYFRDPGRGKPLVDVLQSEHGAWFHHKRNRNMVIEVTEEVPPHEDFCWLTLGQLAELLHQDNVVNMDSRTVLACLPAPAQQTSALASDAQLRSWITCERSRHDVRAELVPLAGLPGWVRRDRAITHAEERYFRVAAVAVRAGNREVHGWTQPMFEPAGTGVNAFLRRTIGGVPHVLAQARVEAGLVDVVELAPTVQCTPANYAHLPASQHPRFLDVVLGADPAAIRYEALHSEEGGRFLDAVCRYLVIDCDESQAPLRPPAGYHWVTPAQLSSLVRHGHYLNVQARTLLACLNAMAARPR
ncbi:NDP-hexose 2,3-dehydratase family protein [Amycolatopsis pithecellobii]|uniref:NDP-hexose 2,3-dehydratase n=1 Tax=Amycolatopsis pithecellobii TaxID=664692 RepID=A0A6N7YRE6_9PSEU|nr:NDP-hexose 2,3-dehydratase family protein [Amycolatopsis pithecellobii]MTD54542.1 NDP-hexose 2,3-dehydratase [Amycolatopsis pithecellobii]